MDSFPSLDKMSQEEGRIFSSLKKHWKKAWTLFDLDYHFFPVAG